MHLSVSASNSVYMLIRYVIFCSNETNIFQSTLKERNGQKSISAFVYSPLSKKYMALHNYILYNAEKTKQSLHNRKCQTSKVTVTVTPKSMRKFNMVRTKFSVNPGVLFSLFFPNRQHREC